MPRRKYKDRHKWQSQAPSVFAHFAEEMTDHVQSSIQYPPQEQEHIVKQITLPDLTSFSDYILHHTDWIQFADYSRSICKDKGLTHVGGGNFTRSSLLEDTFAETIECGKYVNGSFDMSVCSDVRVEDKFMKTIDKNMIVSIMVKKTRGSADKNDNEEEQLKKAKKAFEKWLAEDRYDYMLIIDYVNIRVFATSDKFVKKNSFIKREGFGTKFSLLDSEVIEIEWRKIMPELPLEHLNTALDHLDDAKPFSEYFAQAIAAYKSQFPERRKQLIAIMNSLSET